ncbi:hypothetical protein HFO99_31470 [Rhizobium leguminosarum]|nr:hypothetical protein [Rhizobium leguminosarum]
MGHPPERAAASGGILIRPVGKTHSGSAPKNPGALPLVGQDFHRVKTAHAVIQTGELRLYANFILRQGVIYPNEADAQAPFATRSIDVMVRPVRWRIVRRAAKPLVKPSATNDASPPGADIERLHGHVPDQARETMRTRISHGT